MSDWGDEQFHGYPLQVILGWIADGESVRGISKRLGTPEHQLRLWLHEPCRKEFALRARESGIDSIAEDVIAIADDDQRDPAHKRCSIDARLRLLGKWSQRYADKTTAEVLVKRDAGSLTDDELASIASAGGGGTT